MTAVCATELSRLVELRRARVRSFASSEPGSPSAQRRCARATLYVAGKIHARAAASHARITCARWAGLIVSGGGQADLEGVELENGLIGIATAVGALDSTFSEGVITNALKPFVVNSGSKLTVSHVKVAYTTLTGAHCGLHLQPAKSHAAAEHHRQGHGADRGREATLTSALAHT